MRPLLLAIALAAVACRDDGATRCRITDIGYDEQVEPAGPRYFFRITYAYEHAGQARSFVLHSKDTYERAEIERTYHVGDDVPCRVDGAGSVRFEPR